MKLLLETGRLDVNCKDRHNRTLLLFYASAGYEAAVRLLLESGKVDINCKDSYVEAPLSAAERNRYKDGLKPLKTSQS